MYGNKSQMSWKPNSRTFIALAPCAYVAPGRLSAKSPSSVQFVGFGQLLEGVVGGEVECELEEDDNFSPLSARFLGFGQSLVRN